MSTTELRRLLEAATPGRWLAYYAPDADIAVGRIGVTAEQTDTGEEFDVAHCADMGDEPHRPAENAALIAAAVNALPALLAVAEAAKDLEHGVTCAYREGYCNCDLEDLTTALAALEEVKP